MNIIRNLRKASTPAAARLFHSSAVNKTIYGSISETVGRTPIVKINKLAPANVEMYAKLEYFNPLSSVKDRLAVAVIEHAEQTGQLQPGQTVVEATSGNTGIGLAMVCAEKGYPLVVTMAESFSIERRKVLRALGAKVILTPAAEKGTGMYAKAEELAEKHGWFLARQFENEANAAYHAKTTGPEIVLDFAAKSKSLDYFVTGYGTGGTLQGVGKVLRVSSPNTKIVVSEPAPAQLIGSGIPQERTPEGFVAGSHPAFNPHPIQGWTPDFISKLTGEALEMGLVDDLKPVAPADAIACSLDLASKEGIFTGVSGGATMATALEVAKTAPAGSTILCMIPDTAERYLSTPLFADIEADMNEAEIEISVSTPRAQLPPKEE